MVDKIDPCCTRTRKGIDDELFFTGNSFSFAEDVSLFYIDHEKQRCIATAPQDANAHRRTSSLGQKPTSNRLWDEIECSTCQSTFSNEKLLDLHITEHHDPFFQGEVDGGFACITQTCNEVFKSSVERQVHLQRNHGFPRWFRFCSVSNDGKERDRKLAGKRKWLMSKADPAYQQNMKVDKETTRSSEKKNLRRKKQKEKRALIPCRFFTSAGGCWRGDKCMFLHDTTLTTEIQDREVETLGKALEKSVSLSMPQQITFGGKRRR